MAEINPPGFLQNAGAVHTAEILRAGFNMLVGGRPSNSFPFQARAGVHPTLGDSYLVTQNGTPNMSVLVNTGYAMVAGTENGQQGLYSCVSNTVVTKTITASDPSLPRIDLVVLRVRDTQYSGATNAWAIEVVTGTAASSPAVPTVPANSLVVAQIAVAASTTSIVNANITNKQPFLTAVGGVIPVVSQAERDAIERFSAGQVIWRVDLNMLQIYNGTWLDFPGEVALRPMRISKTLDEGRTVTTLSNDLQLITPSLPANSIWKVEGLIFYSASNAASVSGFKFGWAGPAGCTFDWTPNAKIDTDAANQATSVWKSSATLTDLVNTGGGSFLCANPFGELAIGGTAGQFALRWAQVTANATPTVVKAGSRLYLTRLG